jgi:hypothetical protein
VKAAYVAQRTGEIPSFFDDMSSMKNRGDSFVDDLGRICGVTCCCLIPDLVSPLLCWWVVPCSLLASVILQLHLSCRSSELARAHCHDSHFIRYVLLNFVGTYLSWCVCIFSSTTRRNLAPSMRSSSKRYTRNLLLQYADTAPEQCPCGFRSIPPCVLVSVFCCLNSALPCPAQAKNNGLPSTDNARNHRGYVKELSLFSPEVFFEGTSSSFDITISFIKSEHPNPTKQQSTHDLKQRLLPYHRQRPNTAS